MTFSRTCELELHNVNVYIIPHYEKPIQFLKMSFDSVQKQSKENMFNIKKLKYKIDFQFSQVIV